MQDYTHDWTLTLCRESHFQFPPNSGKYSATNIDQIAIHLFILEMCKCSCDGGVIYNLVCQCFDKWAQRLRLSLERIDQWAQRLNWPMSTAIGAVTRKNTLEQLFIAKFTSLATVPIFVGPGDHSRLGASLASYRQHVGRPIYKHQSKSLL